MSVEYWDGSTGYFRHARHWSQSATPSAGNELHAQSGNITLKGGTFGSADARTTIGLTGDTVAGAPSLTLKNVTLTNVAVSEAPPLYNGPYKDTQPGYYPAKYGTLHIVGTATNDGGLLEGRRNSLGPVANFGIVMDTGATLTNNGALAATQPAA